MAVVFVFAYHTCPMLCSLVLDAARQLFSEHGYQATRTEDVVRRAGLTRGALYHHFASKEDLFAADVPAPVAMGGHLIASVPESVSERK